MAWWGFQKTPSSPTLSALFSAQAHFQPHKVPDSFPQTRLSPPKALWGHLRSSQILKRLTVWICFSVALKNCQGPCPHYQSQVDHVYLGPQKWPHILYLKSNELDQKPPETYIPKWIIFWLSVEPYSPCNPGHRESCRHHWHECSWRHYVYWSCHRKLKPVQSTNTLTHITHHGTVFYFESCLIELRER